MSVWGGTKVLAFIKKVKSNGRYYIYLREYKNMMGEFDDMVTIYRFGVLEKCLENMYAWARSEKEIPQELKKRGFKKKDVYDWINDIELFFSKRKII